MATSKMAPPKGGSGNTPGTSIEVVPNTDVSSAGGAVDTGGGTTSVAADNTVETGTQVNLLGGLVNPATVEEARPRTGSAVSSFLFRRLSKIERDVALLKSAQ